MNDITKNILKLIEERYQIKTIVLHDKVIFTECKFTPIPSILKDTKPPLLLIFHQNVNQNKPFEYRITLRLSFHLDEQNTNTIIFANLIYDHSQKKLMNSKKEDYED